MNTTGCLPLRHPCLLIRTCNVPYLYPSKFFGFASSTIFYYSRYRILFPETASSVFLSADKKMEILVAEGPKAYRYRYSISHTLLRAAINYFHYISLKFIIYDSLQQELQISVRSIRYSMPHYLNETILEEVNEFLLELQLKMGEISY